MEQRKGRRPKKENNEEQYEHRLQRVVVAVPVKHVNTKSTLDFEWPEYTSEKKRIKANTKKYADMSIPEIFGVKVENTNQYDELRELRAGDSIDVMVTDISDTGVTFETVATKQVIQSTVNLKKYQKLRMITPFKAQAVVTKADRQTAYIDIIKPIYESWLKEVLKDPEAQRVMGAPKIVQVKNLRLTRGGFVGQAVIPAVSEYVGQEYTVEAFIPGSQIVLNIEGDFERWNGQTVDTFVTNYMLKPGSKEDMSLVCSRKEVLKYMGDMNIMSLFNAYCEDSDQWRNASTQVREGVVTGIINSSKKCGVFVEVPGLNITGMVEMGAEDIVKYKPQDQVKVQLSGFEENTYYNADTKQFCHDAPYMIEDEILKSCNVKPILKLEK